MNMIDKLMQADAGKLELPQKEYEVKRLSELFGFPFVLQLQAIDPERYSAIQEDSLEMKNGDLNRIRIYEMKTKTLLAGIVEPSLKDKDLQNHFGVNTPKQLVNKLFLVGEITNISDEISKLSGYDGQGKVNEEVKN